MSLVLTQAGLNELLGFGLSVMGATHGKIGLFTNNHTPTEDDTLADYDEPTAGWYARQDLSDWTAPAFSSGTSHSEADPVTWTDDGAGGSDATVYGYFVLNDSDDLVWAELDPGGPFMLDLAGASYTVLPRITQDNA